MVAYELLLQTPPQEKRSACPIAQAGSTGDDQARQVQQPAAFQIHGEYSKERRPQVNYAGRRLDAVAPTLCKRLPFLKR